MKKNGITLTELLVASVLIGIVMIGVASFSVSIKQLQNSTNKSTVLAMKMGAVMNRITRDAFLAVGDEADRGVVPGGAGSNETICFRLDADNDPSSYTGDTWTCYFASGPDILWLCDSGLTPPIDNWGDCRGGAGDRQPLVDLDDGSFHTVVDIQGVGPFQYVEFNIVGIYDRTKAFHPIENPRYILNSRISPPGHSG